MNSGEKKIDTRKTKDSGADTDQYGDGSELTHYLGNDENKSREKKNEKKNKGEVGKVAHGNLKEHRP